MCETRERSWERVPQQTLSKTFKRHEHQALFNFFGNEGKYSLSESIQYTFTHKFYHFQCSIVERFNRSLKEIMWKSFSLNGNYNWIDNLQDYVDFYNKRIHRTIKMAPCDVKEEDAPRLLNTSYNYSQEKVKPPKFKVGDHVRISKYKHVFEKSYTPNWSTEIFTITDVNTQFNPETYYLQDIHKEPIQGGFYRENLQLVKHSDGYLIEKVLKRKPGKIFVKFLGFPAKYNGWIDADTDQ